jgi:hypothetical protein
MKKLMFLLLLITLLTPSLAPAQSNVPGNYGESWLGLPAEAKSAIYFGFLLGRVSTCFNYDEPQRVADCVEYTRMDEPMANRAIGFSDEAYKQGKYGIIPDFFVLAIAGEVAKGRMTKAQAYQELDRLLKQGQQARQGQ